LRSSGWKNARFAVSVRIRRYLVALHWRLVSCFSQEFKKRLSLALLGSFLEVVFSFKRRKLLRKRDIDKLIELTPSAALSDGCKRTRNSDFSIAHLAGGFCRLSLT
jgi:hypothetical protein